MSILATIELIGQPAAVRVAHGNRHDARAIGSAGGGNGLVRDVMVHDVSTTGCRLTGLTMDVGTSFRLGLTGGGVAQGHVVHAAEEGYGCAFSPELSEADFARSFDPRPAVTALQTPPAGREAMAEPAPERWPAPVRLVTLIGSAVAAWGVALTLYRLL